MIDLKLLIEEIAQERAERNWSRFHDQKRAENLYVSTRTNLWEKAKFIGRSSNMGTAAHFIADWYGKLPREKRERKPVEFVPMKPGPELFAFATKDDFRIIWGKLKQVLGGNKSEKNKGIIIKTMVDLCRVFIGVKPEFYNEDQHGKFLPRNEFDMMLGKCNEIITQFG